MTAKIVRGALVCALSVQLAHAASAQNAEPSKPSTPRVVTSQAPMYGSSLNKLPNDEQCRNLLERAKAVPALQGTRDVRYCQSRQQTSGK